MIDLNALDRVNETYGITNRMVLMNKFIEDIITFNDNFIFKGATVLSDKIALTTNRILGRKSLDINIDCVEQLSQEEIIDIIQQACDLNEYILKVKRDLSETKSLRLKIYYKDNLEKEIFSLDISRKDFVDYELCKTINNKEFKSYPIERVFVDKLSIVSSGKIFRRIKDLYDLSVLLKNYPVNCQKILNSFKRYDRVLGNFNELFTSPEELLHAYEKYNSIFDKPDFKSVYYPVVVFGQPLVHKVDEDLVWNIKRQEWCTTGNPYENIKKYFTSNFE